MLDPVNGTEKSSIQLQFAPSTEERRKRQCCVAGF